MNFHLPTIPFDELIDSIGYLDGSLRDIYIYNESLEDWNRLLMLLNDRYPIEYDEKTIPQSIHEIMTIAQDRGFCIRVNIGFNIYAHCHFYVSQNAPNPIEFDLDPRELNTKHGIKAVLQFINTLGNELGFQVHLTEENDETRILLTYSPQSQQFSYFQQKITRK